MPDYDMQEPEYWERRSRELDEERIEGVKDGLAVAVEEGFLKENYTDEVKNYMQDLWNTLDNAKKESSIQVFEGSENFHFSILDGGRTIVDAGLADAGLPSGGQGRVTANFGNVANPELLYDFRYGDIFPGFYAVGRNENPDGEIKVSYAKIHDGDEKTGVDVRVVDYEDSIYNMIEADPGYDFETFGASAVIDPRAEGIQILTLKEDVQLLATERKKLEDGSSTYEKRAYSS